MKPFWYKLTAAEFFAEVRTIPEADKGTWLTNFASDLVAGSSENSFTETLISESKRYTENRSKAGKKGMQNRYSKPKKQPKK